MDLHRAVLFRPRRKINVACPPSSPALRFARFEVLGLRLDLDRLDLLLRDLEF